jgi:hypothetical protein
VNTSRIVARLVLPALVAGAVFGGTVAPASAEPSTAQSHHDLVRDLPAQGGDLLGSDGVVGGLVNSLLGPGGIVDGLL